MGSAAIIRENTRGQASRATVSIETSMAYPFNSVRSWESSDLVSFQILTTTADMMMTAKMASVAMPISMISGAVGASRASRHVATVLHKAVPEDLLEDVALGDDAREADEEVREADGEGRSGHLGGGQAQARDHREADGHLPDR